MSTEESTHSEDGWMHINRLGESLTVTVNGLILRFTFFDTGEHWEDYAIYCIRNVSGRKMSPKAYLRLRSRLFQFRALAFSKNFLTTHPTYDEQWQSEIAKIRRDLKALRKTLEDERDPIQTQTAQRPVLEIQLPLKERAVQRELIS